MAIFLIIGLIFSFLFILVALFVCDHIPPKGYPTINFNLFCNLYNMNPYQWGLFDNHVEYKIPKDGFYETIFFKNYFEYRKYSRWLKKRDKKSKKKE